MLKIKWAVLALSVVTTSAWANVDATLDVLHQAGGKVQSLGADVEMTSINMGTGTETLDRGTIVMQRLPDGDTRAKITFTEHAVDFKLKKLRREFLLDGGKLIEQNEETKKQVTRQVRRPGEKVDLFKLGEGPFPMPIGQSKESVHEQFDVTPGEGDNVVKLVPKKGTPLESKFKHIIVTVDTSKGIPTTIQTLDATGEDKKTVVLKNVRLNEAVKDDEFKLPNVDDKGWQKVDE